MLKSLVTLRGATKEDERFLYEVQKAGMQPVSDADIGPKVDEETSYKVYQSNFKPEEIEVVMYGNNPVGRLRVVRDEKSIYVGGIQILPDFQRQGIGTIIFTELIRESKVTQVPITLEVHKVNTTARAFYTKLGFIESEKIENKIHLVYRPE